MTTAHGPLVHVSSRLPLADYIRLIDWARKRGLIYGQDEHPNISGALREIMALGLAAEAKLAQDEEQGK